MSDWKKITLGEVADIDSGFAFKSKEYTDDGNLRIVRGKNVTVGTMRWGTDAKFWDYPTDGLERYFLAENDIVIGMDGSKIGENRSKIKESALPAILAQRVGRVRAKGQNSQEFLWHAINSDGFVQYIKSIHTGTSIPHISQKQIGNFEIQIPPPSEQNAIAEVLSSLDDKIDLLRCQNQTLEQLAETMFRQWFVEEANESYKKVELGELITINGGFSYKGEFIGSGESLLLGMGCVSFNERFLDSGARSYSGVFPEKHLITPGEIVIATRQQSDNLPILGYPAMIPNEFAGKTVIVGTNLYRVRNNSILENWVLFQLLRSAEYRVHIKSNSKGSTVRMITKDAIESFTFSLPPNGKLDEFTTIGRPLYEKLNYNQTQIRTLTALRDTLLPKLMSGEVRIQEKPKTPGYE